MGGRQAVAASDTPPHLGAHSHRRLVDPSAVGLGVAIGLDPERALLNDANPHLINFYRWLRRGLAITFPMANDRRLYAM